MSKRQFTSSICCIGAGYVGGTTMAVIAKHCPEYKVTVVDINEERIAAWNSRNLPIFEPNLRETIDEAVANNGNLFFSTEVSHHIRESDFIFISVSTPTKEYGRGAGKSFDMASWEAVSRAIAATATSKKIIIEKSTVPVCTAEKVRVILETNKIDPNFTFSIISNPEFLAEGSAIRDLECPDRVLLGTEPTAQGQEDAKRVLEIYKHWVPEEKIVTSDVWTSELAKLASNAFLAQRISTINAFSAICEESGANVNDLSRIIGMDPRIGSRYLSASVGFGGSCLKKDVMALVYIAESYQLYQVAEYFKGIVDINEFQKERFGVRILETMYGTVKRKKLAVLGFAFKKDTGDTRETSAREIVQFLLDEGAEVHIYDPKVPAAEIKSYFPTAHNLHVELNYVSAVTNAHAIIVITEWDEFKSYNYEEIYARMPKPAFVFDGRNILDHDNLTRIGFHVHAVGKRSLHEHTHVVL